MKKDDIGSVIQPVRKRHLPKKIHRTLTLLFSESPSREKSANQATYSRKYGNQDRQQNSWVKMELVSTVDARFLRHDRANE
ncbi:MAG: hypothetical protein JXB10_01615, partial [Pirellulales bacterium]|nr:hypothetical protein [Pirellulales bacterium]